MRSCTEDGAGGDWFSESVRHVLWEPVTHHNYDYVSQVTSFLQVSPPKHEFLLP